MDETDPRVEFARRLRALREATGLSIRRLEIESERTPRRRKEDVLRLKRSTIAGMTNRDRPVRPELANFEVFVDTCLRVATEKAIALPPGLGDRDAWDEAYRDLRDQVDRFPRRNVARPVAEPAPVEPPASGPDEATVPDRPVLTRRRILLVAPVALTAAATGVLVPVLLQADGSESALGGSSSAPGPQLDEDGYSPVGRLLSAPYAKDNPVWSVSIGMLRGQTVAIVGRADGTAQLWNPATGVARSSPLGGHDKPVFSVALSASFAVSASVDGTLRVWDLRADPPASTRLGGRLAAGINSVALGMVAGRTVAVSAGDDRTVRLWDPAKPALTGKVLGKALDSAVKSIAAGTLDGTTIAVSGSDDGTVRLWDLEAGRVVRSLGAHEATVWTMAVGTLKGSPVAVSGGEDGEVRAWDVAALAPAHTVLSRINSAVKTVAVGTVNGRTVAIAGSDDNAIRIWDLATGRPYGNGLTGPDKGAECLAIGNIAGRALVVSGHWDGTIWTWSL